ncbi:MAG: orotate phosphoribosyltransferase [Patescibacteria group bacterium]|nr:orotate phosphoribosyltransferase [Patescibacteria group bacterium]
MKKQLIKDLHNIGSVKFGEFTLKSGIKSPIYIDLRLLASHPKVLKTIAKLIAEKIKDKDCDIIAGIPYTGIPMATAVSLETGIPMIYPRKEIKDYGTKKKIEGVYKSGDKCIVIDDLITSGASKFETVEPLEAEGLIVQDFVVLVDREQGGGQLLADKGYNLHSIIRISELLDTLEDEGLISKNQVEDVRSFLVENSFVKK